MFWGLVFVFLYVLYVYDDSHRHFGVLEKGYDGIKGFDDLRKILGSRIVRDFNENMTWINTMFGSVIGCVTHAFILFIFYLLISGLGYPGLVVFQQ